MELAAIAEPGEEYVDVVRRRPVAGHQEIALPSAQLVDQAGCRRPTHIVERGRAQGSRTRPNRSRPLTGVPRDRAFRRWRLDGLVPSLSVGFAAVHQPAAVALHFLKQIGHLQGCQFRPAEHRVVRDGEQGAVAGVNQLLPPLSSRCWRSGQVSPVAWSSRRLLRWCMRLTSTTASGSISAPSWPMTSPRARKALEFCGSSRMSIGRRNAARNPCVSRASIPCLAEMASSQGNDLMTYTLLSPKRWRLVTALGNRNE